MDSRLSPADPAQVDGLTLSALLAAPPLPFEREQTLARSARRGDSEARAELIRLSLRLAALRVSSLHVAGRDVDDALQAGILGLIAAVDRFNPDRGVRLATYAWPWITAAVRSAVMPPVTVRTEVRDPAAHTVGDLDELVGRLPSRLTDVVRLRFRLGEQADIPRTHAEVAARLGLSVPQVRRAEAQALSRLRGRLARLGDRDPL